MPKYLNEVAYTQPGQCLTRVNIRLGNVAQGRILLNANVTGRIARGERFTGLSSMVLALEDIEAVPGCALDFRRPLRRD
jgi:hypothetical protein